MASVHLSTVGGGQFPPPSSLPNTTLHMLFTAPAWAACVWTQCATFLGVYCHILPLLPAHFYYYLPSMLPPPCHHACAMYLARGMDASSTPLPIPNILTMPCVCAGHCYAFLYPPTACLRAHAGVTYCRRAARRVISCATAFLSNRCDCVRLTPQPVRHACTCLLFLQLTNAGTGRPYLSGTGAVPAKCTLLYRLCLWAFCTFPPLCLVLVLLGTFVFQKPWT